METSAAPLVAEEAGIDPWVEDEPRPLDGAVVALFRSARALRQALREEWAALAVRASEPNAFAEAWFVTAGIDRLADDSDLRIAEVRRDGRLIGLLPLTIAPAYGRLPVRNVQNWLHYHSFLGTPLLQAGEEQAFWSALLAALDAAPWAKAFLHINGLVEDGPVHRGLVAAARAIDRPCDIVLRSERALLESALSPQDYYEQTVRKKKRKELKRLQARLAELGTVATHHLGAAGEIGAWCDAFLALERSGWKGGAGSALGCRPETEAFFRDAVAGAFAAGRLDFLRMDLDGRPLAMLVNFITPPGSFSFKIAFDEEYARFSPGVLLQIENLSILTRPGVEWMDSCAAEDHPMINSLWGERRSIVRVTVPLAGIRRRALFRACRAAESASAALRRRLSPSPSQERNESSDD